MITAAARGIGRATAEAFSREGAEVMATDINESELRTLSGCRTYQLDITDAASIKAFENAGFHSAGTSIIRGNQACHYVLSRKDSI